MKKAVDELAEPDDTPAGIRIRPALWPLSGTCNAGLRSDLSELKGVVSNLDDYKQMTQTTVNFVVTSVGRNRR